MTTTSYNYTYTNPSGYSYTGQVVADTTIPQYNYVPGQTYAGPGSGSYTISGAGTPTTAPPGAVYMTSYTSPGGTKYDSYHYDPKNNAYYDINSGYNMATGMYTPPGGSPVPAWSGIGLGNEYSYVNTAPAGSPPSYQTYGGGGVANVDMMPSAMVGYDYQFMYPDGSSYDGKVYDNGTYGYKVGMTIPKASEGTYTIYAQDPTAPPPTARAGYNYVELYHDASTGTNYAPADIIPSSPTYQKPDGYGGLGSEHDYIQKTGGYYAFNAGTQASASTPMATIPLPT